MPVRRSLSAMFLRLSYLMKGGCLLCAGSISSPLTPPSSSVEQDSSVAVHQKKAPKNPKAVGQYVVRSLVVQAVVLLTWC